MIFTNGQIDQNKTTFIDCRDFDKPSTSNAIPNGLQKLSIPIGTTIPVKLNSQIDSTTAAVGDRIEAIVAKPVKVKGKIIIPEGAILVGRIGRLDHAWQPKNFLRIVGFEWSKLSFEKTFAIVKLQVEEGGSVFSADFPERSESSRPRIIAHREPGEFRSTAVSTRALRLELPYGFQMLLKVY